MNKKLKWGIIGTGAIARTFAKALSSSETGELIAVGSRSQDSANKFGSEFKVAKCYGSYESLLKDKEVDVVYISTPHPFHAEWAVKSARAGKHILCEKPIGINYPEAMAIIESAYKNNVFLMEAFMYRCHPQIEKLIELLKEKVIGEVRVIQATFSFHSAYNVERRLLNNSLGGGGILDVGCYCSSIARLIAGVSNGKNFVEPIEVKGVGKIGETKVDEYAVAVLKFPGEILAQLSTGVQVNQENVVRIFGSEGSILIPDPWIPTREGGTTKIIVTKKGKTQEIIIESKKPLYSIEADTVGKSIMEGKKEAPWPAMTWDDTLGNMRTLDMWRSSFGFLYDSEKPDAYIPTIDREELKVEKGHKMKYSKISGLDKPVSRLVIGADVHLFLPQATVMFDEFIRLGGNCFDTAYIYGSGKSEKTLGQWIKNRNIRKDVIILGKGAHTPYCNPEDLTKQLYESLDRLQTDYIDIYMLHRDNPEIPVGEFIDVLNEHKKAGRIKIFGGSNWKLERIEAANQYAKSKGLSGFSAVSNNFSLARMIEPPWAGCISSSDRTSRDWFVKTQMPLFSWSSQARGFFTGRARPDDFSDKELVRCWYSDDNFKRLERANELAKKKGVLPINIALAYVLYQKFPTFALIGPRTLSELRTSFLALDIELTDEEVLWLNLEK